MARIAMACIALLGLLVVACGTSKVEVDETKAMGEIAEVVQDIAKEGEVSEAKDAGTTECANLDQEACEASDLCMAIEGWGKPEACLVWDDDLAGGPSVFVECAEAAMCSAAFTWAHPPDSEDDVWLFPSTCTPAGWKTVDEAPCCQPDCEGRECGDDGCGGTCGECDEPHECKDGYCVTTCPPSLCEVGDKKCKYANTSYIECLEVPGCPGVGGNWSGSFPCSDGLICKEGVGCICEYGECGPDAELDEVCEGPLLGQCDEWFCDDGCCRIEAVGECCLVGKDCRDCLNMQSGETVLCPDEVPEGYVENLCTWDVCLQGECENTDKVANGQCDDDDTCTKDACDPLTGECVYECDWDYFLCGYPCWGASPSEADSMCDDGDPDTAEWCNYGGLFGPWEEDEPLNPCEDTEYGFCMFPDLVPCGLDDDCDDGDPASIDTCDQQTQECAHCVPDCEGKECGPDGCGGTCGECDDQYLCTDDSCDESTGKCLHVFSCDDGNACTVDSCDPDTGECEHQFISPDDGNPCTEDSCDPQTGCQNLVLPDGTPCSGEAGWICVNGSCVCIPDCQGKECGDDGCMGSCGDCNDDDCCTIDYCDGDNGHCWHEVCDCDDGAPCTVDTPADCVMPGEVGCIHEPKNCDDEDPCSWDYCHPATGQCDHKGITCGDGNACTEDSCDPQTGQCFNTIIDCDDNNQCTVDSCDPAQGCLSEKKDCDDSDPCTWDFCDPETGDCTNQVKDCDDTDFCTDDSCNPDTGKCQFDVVDCDDGDGCTNDYCVPASGCIYSQKCDDDYPCTTDSCDPTTFKCSYEPTCDDGNACTIDWCESMGDDVVCDYIQESCDDGTPCTEDECDPLIGCINTWNFCDDDEPCTEDQCDPATGECTHTTINCDDNNLCTEDACSVVDGEAVCTYTPVDCSDGCCCTYDYCHPWKGCINEEIDCSDFDNCTVDIMHGCAGSDDFWCENKPKDCDDGDPCTVDQCIPATGMCTNTAITCDDNNLCTVDFCSGANGEPVCVFQPIVCDDNCCCTYDKCVPWLGCVYTPVDCSDGDNCTIDIQHGCADTEDPVWCEHQPKYCDDDNLCTDDSCNPDTGICQYAPANCDDGDVCTIDSCLASSGCVHPYKCDDFNPCTTDICDPQTLDCSYEAACDDANECTDDSCVPNLEIGEGECVFMPDNTNECDDGDPQTMNICLDGECVVCVPDCNDKECGEDGCGGSCGECPEGQTCNEGGQCE